MEVFNIIAEGWAAFVAELFVEGGANLGWEPVSRLRRVRCQRRSNYPLVPGVKVHHFGFSEVCP